MLEVKEQCKMCFHFQVCASVLKRQLLIREKMLNEEDPKCEHFISSADVVKIETLKSWLYKIAMNNIGAVIDGDFSSACEEIISRLDGLRIFAKETEG